MQEDIVRYTCDLCGSAHEVSTKFVNLDGAFVHEIVQNIYPTISDRGRAIDDICLTCGDKIRDAVAKVTKEILSNGMEVFDDIS